MLLLLLLLLCILLFVLNNINFSHGCSTSSYRIGILICMTSILNASFNDDIAVFRTIFQSYITNKSDNKYSCYSLIIILLINY